MKPKRFIGATAVLLLGVAVTGISGCHVANHTAGRPGSEDGDGMEGSVTATKEGTGDPRVGSGRGEVGTDATPHEGGKEHPTGKSAR